MKKEETYRKVFINGDESKLPKDKICYYICHIKDTPAFDISYRYYEVSTINWWRNNVDWYLNPTNDKAIIAKMEELIEFYGSVISKNAVFLHVHGMDETNDNIEKGRQLREDLEELKKTQ